MTTLMVATSGGHLRQLLRLLPRLDVGPERVWVTTDTPVNRTLLEDEEALYLRPSGRMSMFKDARNAAYVIRATRELPLQRVIGLGSSLSLAAFAAGRIRGAHCEFIESVERRQGPSPVGRRAERLPGVRLFTQHQSWTSERWNFGGSAFDGFVATAGPAIPPVHRLTLIADDHASRSATLLQQLAALAPATTTVTVSRGAPESLDGCDAVVAMGGVNAAIAAMEAGRFPLLISIHDLEEQPDDDSSIGFWLQATGLAMSLRSEELTWNDICISGSWSIADEPAPPFVNE